MKRPWAWLLAAVVLSGCRSSQQPTNPFLRTTVPPPGTGEAAVVVPGDPYYPGATPAPGTAPAIVAPTPAPQPVVPARDLKKAIPGGSYMYHQSSVERPPGIDADEADARVASSMTVNGAAPDALRLGGASDAIEQAVALSVEPAPGANTSFEAFGGKLPGEVTVDDDETLEPPVKPVADSRTRPSFKSEIHVLSAHGGESPESEPSMPDLDRSSNARPARFTGQA
jgi:hypothetical protein